MSALHTKYVIDNVIIHQQNSYIEKVIASFTFLRSTNKMCNMLLPEIDFKLPVNLIKIYNTIYMPVYLNDNYMYKTSVYIVICNSPSGVVLTFPV